MHQHVQKEKPVQEVGESPCARIKSHWAETVFFLPFRDKKYFARTNDRTNASQLCQRTETTCGQGVESPF